MQNILVIKLRYIGDVLLATPVLQSLRAAWPEARLTVAVNRGTQEVLAHSPHVDEVLVVDRDGWRQDVRLLRDLRQRRFDCVIDLTDSDRSAVMTMTTGAPTRIGFNWEHRWRGIAYSTVVEAAYGAMHMVDYDLCALGPLGVMPATTRPCLQVGPQEEAEAARLLDETALTRRLWIMVHPGARYWFKSWAEDRVAAFLDRLGARGLPSVLVGGAEDREKAERISALCGHPPVNLTGRTSVMGLAALMKHCTFFVGNDAGPMHMAAAVGVPVVALFGPSDPRVWGPRGVQFEVIYKGMDCRRCFHPTCERGSESCMNQIGVDEVVEAVDRLLARSEVGSGRR
jgi:predicted lipopolysaccharide heptosyltransferase III